MKQFTLPILALALLLTAPLALAGTGQSTPCKVTKDSVITTCPRGMTQGTNAHANDSALTMAVVGGSSVSSVKVHYTNPIKKPIKPSGSYAWVMMTPVNETLLGGMACNDSSYGGVNGTAGAFYGCNGKFYGNAWRGTATHYFAPYQCPGTYDNGKAIPHGNLKSCLQGTSFGSGGGFTDPSAVASGEQGWELLQGIIDVANPVTLPGGSLAYYTGNSHIPWTCSSANRLATVFWEYHRTGDKHHLYYFVFVCQSTNEAPTW